MEDWRSYLEQILRFASHGYHWYARVDIPATKSVERVEAKLQAKYPEITYNKDKRYRAKKAGKANYAFCRYERNGILLRSRGMPSNSDDDIWHEFAKIPYTFRVGEFVELKVGRGGRGKYTCYLTKAAYRSLKALLREYFEDQRYEQMQRQWQALSNLPGYSGIIGQVRELYRVVKSWRVPRKYSIKQLKLQDLYRRPGRVAKEGESCPG